MIGDIGGVIDALYLLFYVLLRPVAKFNLQATLVSKLFRYQPKAKLKKWKVPNDSRKTDFINKYFDAD